jgi:cytochrome d ubiquinol oxidase subunit II
MEPYKYFTNFITLWWLLVLFLVGVILVLFGSIKTYLCETFHKGIWFVGIGVLFVVLALLMNVGYNDTAYYPSTCDLQSSLTLSNSCSSEFTLRTMAWVSLFIPFVLAYIIYAWRAIDKKKIEKDEIKSEISY